MPRRRLALLLAALALACASPSALGTTPCGSAGEFGSGGCADLLVVIEEPTVALVPPYQWTLSARSMGGGNFGHASAPGVGFNDFRIVLPPESDVPGDTATVWVIAKVVSPSATDGPLETIVQAADSVRHLLEFADPGSVPPIAAVRLRPR